jgi:hypothetical protein
MKLITEHGAGEDQVTQSGSGKNVIHLLKKVNLNIAAEYYEQRGLYKHADLLPFGKSGNDLPKPAFQAS